MEIEEYCEKIWKNLKKSQKRTRKKLERTKDPPKDEKIWRQETPKR